MSSLTEAIAAAERLRKHATGEALQPVRQRCDDERVLAHFAVSILADPLQLVKPLDWEEKESGWIARTPVGNWHIWRDLRWARLGEFSRKCPSFEAGKAACEADYRERLRGIFKPKE